MISMVKSGRIGNSPTKPNPVRRLNQLRRILALIDTMAPMRRFRSIEDIAHILRDRMGESFCDRTVRRDMDLLVEMGLAECEFVTVPRGGPLASTYRLNLRQSEVLQTAAIKQEETRHAG